MPSKPRTLAGILGLRRQADRAYTLIKRDCVAAGLGTKTRAGGTATGQERYDLADDSGRALDFHCLRVTFVSNLVAAGVHPRVAQALARHAKVKTTMAVYADLTALDLRGAVERAGGAVVASRAEARSG